MPCTISILETGAMPGAAALQTDAIQRAIDRVFAAGGGEVTIPAGVFRSGDIRLRSNVTLHLLCGSRLLGSRDPMDYFHYRTDPVEPLDPAEIADVPYVPLGTIHGETVYEPDRPDYRFKRLPGTRWNNALIRAIDAENIAVIADEDAEIDGCNPYDSIGEESYRGPHGMTLFRCSNIRLRGYTIRDTGNWAHNLLFCTNITVNNIHVLAGHDGFDAAVCTNVSVCGSEFRTGDDCIAGFGNTNVRVADCLLNSSCSALRFGGTNVLVRGCVMEGPGTYGFRGALPSAEKISGAPSVHGGRRMLSAFTYYADYSLPIPEQPGAIRVEDCQIRNTDRFLHYNFSGNETWQRQRPLESIMFRNVTAEGIARPLTAYGTADCPLTLELQDVDVTMRSDATSVPFLQLAHYDEVRLTRVRVTNTCAPELIQTWTDGEIRLRGVAHGAACDVCAAAEPFVCGAI